MDKDWRNLLKRHIKSTGTTQTAIAKRLGVTQGAVGHWLSGRRELNLSEFFALCRSCDADPQTILFNTKSNSERLLKDIRKLLDQK